MAINAETLIAELNHHKSYRPKLVEYSGGHSWFEQTNALSLVLALQENEPPVRPMLVDYLPNTNDPSHPDYGHFGGMKTIDQDRGEREIYNSGLQYSREWQGKFGPVEYRNCTAPNGIVLPLINGVGLWRTNVSQVGVRAPLEVGIPVVADTMVRSIDYASIRDHARSYLDSVAYAESILAVHTSFGYRVQAKAHEDGWVYVDNDSGLISDFPASNWVTGGRLPTLLFRNYLAGLIRDDQYNNHTLFERSQPARYIVSNAEWDNPPEWRRVGAELVLTGEVNPIVWKAGAKGEYMPLPVEGDMLRFDARGALEYIDHSRIVSSNEAIMGMVGAGLGMFNIFIDRLKGYVNEREEILIAELGRLSVAKTLLDLLAVYQVDTQESAAS